MEMEVIFNKLEGEIVNLRSLQRKLNTNNELVFDKEANVIMEENELIKSDAFKELKNDRERKAFLGEKMLEVKFELFKAKQHNEEIKNDIELCKNNIKMFNRMLDNKFYDGDVDGN